MSGQTSGQPDKPPNPGVTQGHIDELKDAAREMATSRSEHNATEDLAYRVQAMTDSVVEFSNALENYTTHEETAIERAKQERTKRNFGLALVAIAVLVVALAVSFVVFGLKVTSSAEDASSSARDAKQASEDNRKILSIIQLGSCPDIALEGRVDPDQIKACLKVSSQHQAETIGQLISAQDLVVCLRVQQGLNLALPNPVDLKCGQPPPGAK